MKSMKLYRSDGTVIIPTKPAQKATAKPSGQKLKKLPRLPWVVPEHWKWMYVDYVQVRLGSLATNNKKGKESYEYRSRSKRTD